MEGQASRARIAGRAGWILLVLGLVLLFFVPAHGVGGDGRQRLDALESLLAGHGIPSTKYPLIGSLPAIPLILLGHVVGSPDWWVARYNVLVYGSGLGLLFLLMRGSLTRDVLIAFLLLLGTASMFPNALTDFGAETFTAMAIGVGLVAWSDRRWKAGAVLLAVGVANQPATIVGLGLALGWWAWRHRLGRAAIPIMFAAALVLADNLIRRGSPLKTGYEGDHGYPTLLPYSGLPGFSYPTLLGVGSLLLSSGKGLLFFSSGLVLGFGRGLEAVRPMRDALVMWLLQLGGMVLVYGTWWAWYGGYAWGPRFLLFASLPASLLLAGFVRRPPAGLVAGTVVVVVLIVSAWVGIDGAVYGQFAQATCTANHYFLESFCWYVPEYSVLWTPLVFQAPFSWRAPAMVAYAVATCLFLAWPLFLVWWSELRRRLRAMWAARHEGPAWRF